MTAEHSSEEAGEGLSEIRARIAEREDEWAWHEQPDDQLAGYGFHMGQMLYRLPRDGQTRDMQESVESMLADLNTLATRAESAEAERDDLRGRLAVVDITAILDAHLPGDYTHLFHDDPGTVDPPVGCRCGWRRERGVSQHDHLATVLRAALANPSAAQGEGEVGAHEPPEVCIDDCTCPPTSVDNWTPADPNCPGVIRDRRFRRQMAAAWDDGHDSCCAVYVRHCATAHNPYRDDSLATPAPGAEQ